MANKKVTPKTQLEISRDQQVPYDTARGNPNDLNTKVTQRANQLSSKGDNNKPLQIGLMDIDEAVFYYMENIIKPSVIQNGIRVNVPVVYKDSEKWNQFQKQGHLRDKKGELLAPIILLNRTNIENNRSLTNKLDANNPHNIQVFTKFYNKGNAYDSFNLLNKKSPQKQFFATVVPDYVTINYDVIMATYYMEQMNKIIEDINYASNSYWGNPERFKFKAMIGSFGTTIENAPKAERLIKTTFNIKLYGYIIPNNLLKNTNVMQKFNEKTKLTFTTETVRSIDSIPGISPFNNINHRIYNKNIK